MILYGFTVISSIAEPVLGWIDNVNGPIGLMLACGKGITQVTLAHKDSIPDFMAVDVSIKAMIVAAYHRGIHKYVFCRLSHNNNNINDNMLNLKCRRVAGYREPRRGCSAGCCCCR